MIKKSEVDRKKRRESSEDFHTHTHTYTYTHTHTHTQRAGGNTENFFGSGSVKKCDICDQALIKSN